MAVKMERETKYYKHFHRIIIFPINQLLPMFGTRSSGHWINNFGWVGSQVSVTDLVSDPVFVVFACALLSVLGREYATLESVRLQ